MAAMRRQDTLATVPVFDDMGEPTPNRTPSRDAILSNLQSRFYRDIRHTRIGCDVLVSINPYKSVEEPGRPRMHPGQAVPAGAANPPGLEDLAAAAWWHMVRGTEDQSVIARGECGSGKTTATRKFLGELCKLGGGIRRAGANMPLRVRKAAGVAEVFGSASTQTNPQSTRQLLYVEVHFDDVGTMLGAKLANYFPETARVTSVPIGEENFSIFNMLVAGARAEERTAWRLGAAFPNLAPGNKAAAAADASAMAALRRDMSLLGIGKRDQGHIFRTLAAVLHLSRVEFEEAAAADGPASVKNREQLRFVSSLLEVDAGSLETALTTRTVLIGEDLCSDFLPPADAVRTRDRLARALYGLLTGWLVDRLNLAVAGQGAATRRIGLVDMPGFENRPLNGLYQLGVNFAAERFGQHCADALIRHPAEILRREGLPCPAFTSFEETYDACVRMFCREDDGVLRLIDRETTVRHLARERPPGADDRAVLDALNARHGAGEARYLPQATGVCIRHYLGPVNYDCRDLLDANWAAVSPDFVRLFRTRRAPGLGREPFAAVLFDDRALVTERLPSRGNAVVHARQNFAARGPSRPRDVRTRSADGTATGAAADAAPVAAQCEQGALWGTTLLSQLRISLDDLCDSLSNTRLWHIICINPNDQRAAGVFDFQKVLNQIVGHGLLDLVRVKQAARWSVRMTFRTFVNRYGPLLRGELGEAAAGVGNLSPITDTLGDLIPPSPRQPAELYSVQSPMSIDHSGADELDEKNKEEVESLVKRQGWTAAEVLVGQRTVFIAEHVWRDVEGWLSRQEDPELAEIWKDGAAQSDETDAASIVSCETEEADGDDGSVACGDCAETGEETSGGGPRRARKDREVDLEKGIDAERPGPAAGFAAGGPARRAWLRVVRASTFWISSCLLRTLGGMGSEDARLLWREKFALCLLLLFLWAASLVFVIGGWRAACAPDGVYSASEIAEHADAMWISWNGRVYDVSKYEHPGGRAGLLRFAGADASTLFPRNATQCPPTTRTRRVRSERDGESSSQGLSAVCSRGTENHCHDTEAIQEMIATGKVAVKERGLVGYTVKEIAALNKGTGAFVVLKNRVYDVTGELRGVPGFLQPVLGAIKDSGAEALDEALTPYVACMEEAYFAGVIKEPARSCAAADAVFLAAALLTLLVTLFKHLAAFWPAPARAAAEPDKFCVLLVPCFAEGEGLLRRTLGSLACSRYDDTRKLLFVVADGMVRGSGSTKPTSEIVLDVLGVPEADRVTAEACSYLALSSGSKQHNRAKVYAGLYNTSARDVPYVVVVKCGTETETLRPGHRGKRDSQLILMRILNKIHYQSAMTALELEIVRQMKTVLGVDPKLYEYCLMVDAGTEVSPESIGYMVSAMVRDSGIMGVTGETLMANRQDSWLTKLQAYDYYLSNQVVPGFESVTGAVSCLPGWFCMYRIKSPVKNAPILCAPEVIHDYATTRVDTLHRKNLVLAQEDRYLTTLMLKHFPSSKTKFVRGARCWAQAPARACAFVARWRRAANSSAHCLPEILLARQPRSALCCSVRLRQLLQFLGAAWAPASFAFLCYLALLAAGGGATARAVLLFAGLSRLAPAALFVARTRFGNWIWAIAHVAALPVWSFALPMYAFWRSDAAAGVDGGPGQRAGGGGGGPGDRFDPAAVPSKTLAEFEREVQANPPAPKFAGKSLSLQSLRRAYYSCPPSAASSVHGGSGGQLCAPASRRGSSSEPLNKTASPVDPMPSEEDILGEIRKILAGADLNLMTKRKVRDQLSRHYRVDMSPRREFISRAVELIVQGQL